MVLPIKDDNPTRSRPILVLLLIGACAVAFFAVQPGVGSADEARFLYQNAAIPCEVMDGHPLSPRLFVECAGGTAADVEGLALAGLPPDREIFPDKNVWLSLLASMFLHGSVAHLGGNMLFLWIFGNNVEDRFGKVGFVALYAVAGVGATLAHVFTQPDSTVPLIGASGAIAGVMGAYLVCFPRARVLTVLPPLIILHLPAWVVLMGWFGLQFLTNPNAGVAVMAHVGGFVIGAVLAALTRLSGVGEGPRGGAADGWYR